MSIHYAIMDDIYYIYHNEFGISFQWKRDAFRQGFNKFQLVFRDTGFYLSHEEIKLFSENIESAKSIKPCMNCGDSTECRNILLRTPSCRIDLAVNKQELSWIEDLVRGTLFQIQLDGFINELCDH
ncbi:hypothetical protein GWK08_12585 [Leptobacterium flavescens]|uniref:Uncharacterized protein n=1 Tax=Leptobacterium flavescens TaxID=472055 RepID=A0A6P0UP63_9FLAO|nr:hypothetical protein [Leptobacterium flavescens]NER14282.1 hypothetical protein [Leptobacterium flavescens]